MKETVTLEHLITILNGILSTLGYGHIEMITISSGPTSSITYKL